MNDASHPPRVPAEGFPPGEYLAEELEARGWSQSDLAEILDRPARLVNEIIKGKRAVTPETAKGLAQAFGTSPELWMNLESAYQLSRVQHVSDAVARRSKLYELAPIKEMGRRGWLAESTSVEAIEQQVKLFFGIKSLDERPRLEVAARAKSEGGEWTPSQRAWFFRVRHLGAAVNAAPYSEKRLSDALSQLHALLASAEDIRHVPRVLAEGGIRLVLIEDLPGTKIDGACIWLNKASPVVALSLRYDRIDSFWHTLFHELGHVKQGLSDSGSLDVELVGHTRPADEERPPKEIEADRFASDQLIPQAELQDFIARTRPLYARERVEAFSARIKIHPGVVLGQLKYRGEVDWRNLVGMHVKIRSHIIPAALCDGYGQIVPVPLS